MRSSTKGKDVEINDSPRKLMKRQIAEALRDGQDKFTLIKELTINSGLGYMDASNLVNEVHSKFVEYRRSEDKKKGESVVVDVTLGVTVAALLSGALWGGLAITLGVGNWGALLVGIICGSMVVKLSRGQHSRTLQAIAVMMTLVGILIGKYVVFCHVVARVLIQNGVNIPKDASMFDPRMMTAYLTHLDSAFGVSGFIFTVLAMAMAWAISNFIVSQSASGE